jgi:hypothetical protein
MVLPGRPRSAFLPKRLFENPGLESRLQAASLQGRVNAELQTARIALMATFQTGSKDAGRTPCRSSGG